MLRRDKFLWLTRRWRTIATAFMLLMGCFSVLTWAQGVPQPSLASSYSISLVGLSAFLLSSGLLGLAFTCGVLFNRISQLERKTEKVEQYCDSCHSERLQMEREHGEQLAAIRPTLQALQTEIHQMRQSGEGA